MIKQPVDKFSALRDKREWNEIRKDPGYFKGLWESRKEKPKEQPIHIAKDRRDGSNREYYGT